MKRYVKYTAGAKSGDPEDGSYIYSCTSLNEVGYENLHHRRDNYVWFEYDSDEGDGHNGHLTNPKMRLDLEKYYDTMYKD